MTTATTEATTSALAEYSPIPALETERDALRQALRDIAANTTDVDAFVTASQALDAPQAVATALPALQKDAERYRWLRAGCDEKQSAASSIAANCYGLEWDAKIDAAMASAPGTGAA